MKRVSVILLGLVLAVSLAVAGSAGGARKAAGKKYRWDLVAVNFNLKTVTPGGTAVSQDAATQDKLMLTGSGHFRPSRRLASGGGTFVHQHSDGSEVGHGVYFVTGFRSFRAGGGKPPAGFRGTIARPGLGRPESGILKLSVRFVPEVEGKPGPAQNVVLTIKCHFEPNRLGLKEADEGFLADVEQFHFRQVPMQGFTVFHELT